jgi:hypothetical protein
LPRKTAVVKKTLDPDWGETLEFAVAGPLLPPGSPAALLSHRAPHAAVERLSSPATVSERSSPCPPAAGLVADEAVLTLTVWDHDKIGRNDRLG